MTQICNHLLDNNDEYIPKIQYMLIKKLGCTALPTFQNWVSNSSLKSNSNSKEVFVNQVPKQ